MNESLEQQTERPMLDIKDYRGVVSASRMRQFFEGAVKQTPVFAKHFPLDVVANSSGEFINYKHQETHTLWVGFAIGMRCQERVELASTTP